MSTQRLAIVTALATHRLMRNESDADQHNRSQFERQERPNGTQFHGNVNYLLGGAMLTVMMTLVCFVCYCCHRNMRKRSEAIYRQRWMEAEANMEIYSVTQCYDLNGDLREVHQQINSSPSITPASIGHGPPPSYDAVVAMDQEIDDCDKCTSRCYRAHASRRPSELNKYSIDRIDSEDSMTDSVSHQQILHVADLNHNGNHMCNGGSETNSFDLIRKCRGCGQEMTLRTPTTQSYPNEGCDCGTAHWMEYETHPGESQYDPYESAQSRRISNSSEHLPSTSNVSDGPCDLNGNRRSVDRADEENGNTTVDLDTMNDNGLIRMDMSQIIDRTGLPTYEAALKLESSGYV